MSPRSKLTHKSGRSLLNPQRWGLSTELIDKLPEQFDKFFNGFRDCFKTKTWNNWQYANLYLTGLFCMDTKRNYSAIGRTMNDPRDDGQNIQHFMSDSSWDAHRVFAEIQRQIKNYPELTRGALVIDGSSDGKKGKGAGVSRQYSGRLGKVDSCQACVSLGYHKDNVHVMVDANMYFTKEWFDQEHKELWPSSHIPEDLEFKTKTEIAADMVLQAKNNGLPFEVVCCDDEYGKTHWLRRLFSDNGLTYVADVPSDTLFYLEKPSVEIPVNMPGIRGRRYWKKRPVCQKKPVRVDKLARDEDLEFYRIKVRNSERGILVYEMAFLRGWTVSRDGQEVLEETLMIRKDPDGSYVYSLSNSPAETPYDVLALWKSHRYFVERVFQDAKTDLGWDELIAVKYRSWMHHTALIAIGLWFIGLLLMFFGQDSQKQSRSLCRQLKLNVLPSLSAANLRLIFKTSLCLSYFKYEECLHVIMQNLVNRAKSTRSRLEKEHGRKFGKICPRET